MGIDWHQCVISALIITYFGLGGWMDVTLMESQSAGN